MSNGDDETTADPEADAEDDPAESPEKGVEDETVEPAPDIETFEARLDDLEAALDAAETEDDLDDVEADANALEKDLTEAEFPVPEPEDEDEEPDDPKEPLENRLGDIRDGIEDRRGPYGEDVQSDADDAATWIRDTRLTRDGKPAVRAAVETFLETAGGELEEAFDLDTDGDGTMAEAIEAVGETAADGRLDADDDAETIAGLLEAADELDAALDEAEEWDDLEIAEQLNREGFYERLTPETRKDFPPELGVVRIAEAENDPERILMALDSLDSDFMEENCIDALRRLAPEEAVEPMQELAQRRDQGAIEVLGKIGDERAVGTLIEFVNSGNPPLQKVTIRALGEIGSEEASQEIANAMADDDQAVRSVAARALGLIGDTRAIEPLSTRLEAAAEHADDRAYTVQHEAEIAHNAIA